MRHAFHPNGQQVLTGRLQSFSGHKDGAVIDARSVAKDFTAFDKSVLNVPRPG